MAIGLACASARRLPQLEKARFIDENVGGPGVRLRDRQRPKKPK